MKFLFISILCVFFSAALGATNLTCLSCSIGESQCNSTCTGEACITIREDNTWESPNGTYTGCVNQSSECKPFAFTLSLAGNLQLLSNVVCCMTDNCNGELLLNVPPSSNFENGVHCPASKIDNQNVFDSKTSIACKGAENKCLSFTANSATGDANNTETIEVKGCSTESACSLVQDDFIAFGSKTYKLSGKATCTNRGTLSALSSVILILPAAVSFLMSNLLS